MILGLDLIQIVKQLAILENGLAARFLVAWAVRPQKRSAVGRDGGAYGNTVVLRSRSCTATKLFQDTLYRRKKPKKHPP